jgi:hypothetical protein
MAIQYVCTGTIVPIRFEPFFRYFPLSIFSVAGRPHMDSAAEAESTGGAAVGYGESSKYQTLTEAVSEQTDSCRQHTSGPALQINL